MKQTNKVLFAFLIAAFILYLNLNNSISQVTDKDGNTYKTVTIGKQVWMAENLNVSQYRNGDAIPQVQDKEEWDNLTTGAWCYYENNSANGTTYGRRKAENHKRLGRRRQRHQCKRLHCYPRRLPQPRRTFYQQRLQCSFLDNNGNEFHKRLV